MTKFIASFSNPWRLSSISRVFSAIFYSSEAQSDTLYKRLSGVGDPKISMVPLLDQWLQEGRDVKKTEIHGIVKQLRKYRRYTHALQVQDWMTEKLKYEIQPAGIAIRLDLISKLHGIDKAEKYFDSIPSSSKDSKVYGAMINCYAHKKMVGKAEELFQKMKELDHIKTALTYNVMLSIYSGVGNLEKLDNLVQEMKEKGIAMDSYTYNIQLNAYASTDVERMDKLLMEMEADSKVAVDLARYFTLFKGYQKAGLTEKMLHVIEQAEELIKKEGTRTDYEHLITLYASVGKKDEVYRVWDMYKNMGKLFNTGYLSMISSLMKLDDLDGVEKIVEEWDSGRKSFDPRIVNYLVITYCKRGLLEKALACAERFTSGGEKLGSLVWHWLAIYCCKDGQMAKAVEMMKNAILSGGRRFNIHRTTLAECVEYLKREADKEAALELVRLVREKGIFRGEICDRLVDFVKSDEETGALAAMERKKEE